MYLLKNTALIEFEFVHSVVQTGGILMKGIVQSTS